MGSEMCIRDSLLAGQDGGSKLAEAAKLEVQIISEHDFETMVAGN